MGAPNSNPSKAAYWAAIACVVVLLLLGFIAVNLLWPKLKYVGLEPVPSRTPSDDTPVAEPPGPPPPGIVTAPAAPRRNPPPNPLAPVTLAPAATTPPRIAGPVSIAPSQLNVTSPGRADPLDYALHPSHYADPAKLAGNIGLAPVSIPAPVDLTGNTTQPAAEPAPRPPDAYANAVRMEKARAITMAMCTDKQGNLWCATEGNGVQVWNPNKPPLESWTEYTTKNSALLDDWCYAIACDTVGRIWVGTLDHGLCVFNGTKWQTYEVLAGLSAPDTLNGPIGSRVFKIVVNPKDGDVWSATEWGLCRYSQSKNTWTYYTKAEGLPSDQANSMAFDSDGNIYVATQCEGIAIAKAANNYATWQTVTGPIEEPKTPTGTGLPSNLMNDILVASDGTIYASTDSGLAWSRDHGQSWQYVRGRNYADKVRLAVVGPPKGWTEQPGAFLAEDYCTNLMDAGANGIWLGHRETAAELVDANNASTTPVGSPMYSQCSTIAANRVIFGTCADNLASLASLQASLSPQTQSPATASPMPAGAALPTDAELRQLTEKVAAATQPAFDGGFFYGEDWNTGGDWEGHYGAELAVLCAQGQGRDEFAAGPEYTWFMPAIGPGHFAGDPLRAWVWNDRTDDTRALYNPQLGYRRQAEADDHGEVYSQLQDTPGIDFDFTLPTGPHLVSLYFRNDNGDGGRNRYRDWIVDVRHVNPLEGWAAEPWSPRARVLACRAGAYTTFLLGSAGRYRVHIHRNYSVNVMCSGFFAESLRPPLAGSVLPQPWQHFYSAPKQPLAERQAAAAGSSLAFDLYEATEGADGLEAVPGARRARTLALRRLTADALAPATCAAWRWRLDLWAEADHAGFENAMKSMLAPARARRAAAATTP